MSTTDPDALFTSEQVDQYFVAFSGLSGTQSGTGIGTRADPGDCPVDPDGSCAAAGTELCEEREIRLLHDHQRGRTTRVQLQHG